MQGPLWGFSAESAATDNELRFFGHFWRKNEFLCVSVYTRASVYIFSVCMINTNARTFDTSDPPTHATQKRNKKVQRVGQGGGGAMPATTLLPLLFQREDWSGMWDACKQGEFTH
jgi:hypothetical protein